MKIIKAFLICMVLVHLSLADDEDDNTCPDYSPTKVSGASCDVDWECTSLCCDSNVCKSKSVVCDNPDLDVCPSKVPPPEDPEEPAEEPGETP